MLKLQRISGLRSLAPLLLLVASLPLQATTVTQILQRTNSEAWTDTTQLPFRGVVPGSVLNSVTLRVNLFALPEVQDFGVTFTPETGNDAYLANFIVNYQLTGPFTSTDPFGWDFQGGWSCSGGNCAWQAAGDFAPDGLWHLNSESWPGLGFMDEQVLTTGFSPFIGWGPVNFTLSMPVTEGAPDVLGTVGSIGSRSVISRFYGNVQLEYEGDFRLAVPEPSGWLLAISGIGLAGLLRRYAKHLARL